MTQGDFSKSIEKQLVGLFRNGIENGKINSEKSSERSN